MNPWIRKADGIPSCLAKLGHIAILFEISHSCTKSSIKGLGSDVVFHRSTSRRPSVVRFPGSLLVPSVKYVNCQPDKLHLNNMPPRLWIPGGSDKEMKYMTDRMRRSEALSLYREIIRSAKHFHWADEKTGRPWNVLLRENARREFEASREEKDPLVISRMIVTGRDCLQQVQNRFNDATQAAWKRIETDSARQASRSDPKTPEKR
jgi:Complex 1 protein (LYR family)